MLKSGLNMMRKYLYGKTRCLARTNSYWTDLYPFPEPSFLKKQADKICDWIYVNLDSFFQGSTKRYKAGFNNSLSTNNNFSYGYSKVWVLNQGVVDIAFKDIKESLNWLLPGFIRQFANRIHQESLLYLFTDYIIEDGSSESDLLLAPNVDSTSGNKGNTIYVFREFKEENNSKFLSISDWWFRLFNKIILFTRIETYKKTYYISTNFTSHGYDYSIDNQNYMIRGPDKSKLNLSFSFHKRN